MFEQLEILGLNPTLLTKHIFDSRLFQPPRKTERQRHGILAFLKPLVFLQARAAMGAQSPSCDILPNDGIALLATSDLADAEAWAARGLRNGGWEVVVLA